MERQSLVTNPALFEEICRRLESGESLNSICKPPMPSSRRFLAAVENKQEMARRYAQAREIGYDTIAENTREVARGKGESSGDVQRDKLTIDTDLRLLSVWNPKKYSERKQIDMNVTISLEQLISQSFAPIAIESAVIDNEPEALW